MWNIAKKIDGIVFMFLIGGFLGSYFGINLLIKGENSKKWPIAKGRVFIAKSHLFQQEDKIDFVTSFVYEYEVNGIKFTSNDVSLFDYEKPIWRYPVGTSVTVFYNPNRPKEAVLEPGVPWFAFCLIVFSFIAFVFGSVMGLKSASEYFDKRQNS